METCFREGSLYSVQLELTEACAQRCVYCYAGGAGKGGRTLDAATIRDILSDVLEVGGQAVDWLGGDPLLAPAWHDLMGVARASGLRNNVWTSGAPLRDPEVAARVAEVTSEGGFVSIHLDTLDPSLWSQLHRRAGEVAIAEIQAGLDNLIAAGKPASEILNCITYTALQPLDDLEATIRWFREEKGMETCLVLFKPAGAGSAFGHLTPLRETVRDAYLIRNEHGGPGVPLGSQDVTKFYCGTKCCVTFDGEVTPCSLVREGIDNVFRRPFREIFREHREQLLLLPLHREENLPEGCRRCPNNGACWGCRTNAFYYSGDLLAADPECWLDPTNARAEETPQ